MNHQTPRGFELMTSPKPRCRKKCLPRFTATKFSGPTTASFKSCNTARRVFPVVRTSPTTHLRTSRDCVPTNLNSFSSRPVADDVRDGGLTTEKVGGEACLPRERASLECQPGQAMRIHTPNRQSRNQPQGSPISPYLCNIFVGGLLERFNDGATTIPRSLFHADDGTLLSSSSREVRWLLLGATHAIQAGKKKKKRKKNRLAMLVYASRNSTGEETDE